MKNFDREINMGMPLQAMPVERQICGAAISSEAGMEASAWWDTLLNVAKTVAPIAMKAAPIIAGALL